MASTNRIAPTLLALAEETSEVSLSFSQERLVLDFTCAQVGTRDSICRLIIRDTNGKVVKNEQVIGSDTQRVSIESADVDSNLNMTGVIECLAGSATVRLDEITGAAAFGTGSGGSAVQTADLADGILAASVAGRAKMATGFFTEAKATDAFAAAAIATALLKRDAGLLTADATGRALMATAYFNAVTVLAKFGADSLDAAACAAIIANGAIPVAKVAAAPLSLESVVADPGNAGTLTPTGSGTCPLTIGTGAETMTLAAPPGAVGYAVMVCADVVGGGTRALQQTAAAAFNAAGSVTCTFNSVNDWALFVAVQVGGAPVWRLLASDGVVLT